MDKSRHGKTIHLVIHEAVFTACSTCDGARGARVHIESFYYLLFLSTPGSFWLKLPDSEDLSLQTGILTPLSRRQFIKLFTQTAI